MRQRLRSHLTFANVCSLAALFLALGGTTYAATYVVSSNSQIGPGTVSGHAGTATNKNIIAGSINGQDVADNSVHTADITNNDIRSGDVRDDNYAGGGLTGSDIAGNSLSGSDVEESTLNGVARKIIYDDTAVDSPPMTTLLSLGAYTLKASCQKDAPGVDSAIHVFVNGPGGTFNDSHVFSQDDANPFPVQSGKELALLTDEPVLYAGAFSGHYTRITGTFFLQAGGILVQVDYNAAVDARAATRTCFLYGTATFGT